VLAMAAGRRGRNARSSRWMNGD